MIPTIKPKERDAVLQSLQAGVVPRIGLQHIQVGRKDEVNAIFQDLARMEDGGASIRFIIGRFGAGKSFFLNLIKVLALEKGFVVANADITPDRRPHATGGQARSLYKELLQNASTRSKSNGNGLPSIVERFVSDIDHTVRRGGGSDPDVANAIYDKLKPLQNLVSGYDFATVISKYFEGFQTHNEALMTHALRWLRGEYTTKTEAKNDLGVREIIDDSEIYDYLKVIAAFVKMAGYKGFLVGLDEMGVLSHRLNHAQARNANYEIILRILNDCLQGNVSHMGFIFAGTDGFLDDRRRGLASYEALSSRLAANSFVKEGLKDFSSPVIRLPNLSTEDFYVLISKIRHVFASGDSSKYLVPDEGLEAFMNHCLSKLGAEFYQTPRESVKAFVGFMSVLEQNPNTNWRDLLQNVSVEKLSNDEEDILEDEVSDTVKIDAPKTGEDDQLATLRL